ncbi:MAG: recombination regulator RecX [Pseudomonadota bacterium]|nr:recombination regulator RecX [Pseudomonadota bacterium]
MKGRALQWLSQREHSRAELRRKLLPHAATPDHDAPLAEVEQVLDWLAAHRYLSDERFAESRVNARSARYGNLRIRQELKQHQVTLPPEVEQALRESEWDRAIAVRQRKFPNWPATPHDRAKQARFLAGRGFSPELIGRLLRTMGASGFDEGA